MKVQRNIIYSSVLMLLLSLYFITKPNDANFSNVLIGIIASSIVLLGSSIVAYTSEKKKCIDNLMVDLRNFCDELGMMRTSSESVDILYNIALLEKCRTRLLGKLKHDCLELSCLFGNNLRKHIFTAILDPIDSIFLEISTHHGMLRWIQLYKEDEDMICAHYLECLRLNSRNPKENAKYLSIEKYLKISNQERIKYHNDEIIKALIYPRKIDSVKGDTVIHVLLFVHTEISMLYFLPRKVFLRRKDIENMRISSNKTAKNWDKVSDEIHNALKEEIKEIKKKQA